MNEQYVMAVDLGTSYIKAGIYDGRGVCLSGARRAVTGENGGKGVFFWKGEVLLGQVIACMRQAADPFPEAARIGAIAFTGQMAGFIGVDSGWNDLTSWSCSLDTRYLPFADDTVRRTGGRMREISGTASPLMAPKIRWFMSEFPSEAKKAARYMMLNSYILGKLGECGIEQAAMDHTLIGWTGLADIRKKSWSDEICQALQIPKGLLPKIVPPETICGRLSGSMAKLTGMKSGTPLVIGAGDKVAGCVGAGIEKEGDMIFEAASYGGFSCVTAEYRPNLLRPYYDGICGLDGILAHKYLPGSGVTLSWFVEHFAGEGKGGFSEMERKAAVLGPGCGGLCAIGLLGGSAMPFDDRLKGMWMGVDWSHRPEHFYRALLESFSFDLALTIDSVEEMYPGVCAEEIVMTGGGAASALWGEILADVTGRTVRRQKCADASLWGTALIARRALGLETAPREQDQTECRHVPVPARREIYQPLKERYERFRRELHGYFAQL